MENLLLNVKDHQKDFDCKLIIMLSGNKEFIRMQLFDILIKLNAGEKPNQGTTIQSNGVESIVTPVWDKKQFL